MGFFFRPVVSLFAVSYALNIFPSLSFISLNIVSTLKCVSSKASFWSLHRSLFTVPPSPGSQLWCLVFLMLDFPRLRVLENLLEEFSKPRIKMLSSKRKFTFASVKLIPFWNQFRFNDMVWGFFDHPGNKNFCSNPT